MNFHQGKWIKQVSLNTTNNSNDPMIPKTSYTSQSLPFYQIFSQSSIVHCCSHAFAVFDKDHNGTLDFHELVLTVAAGTPTDLDSRLDYVFQM